MPQFTGWTAGTLGVLQITAAVLAVLFLPGAALSVWISPRVNRPSLWLAEVLGLSLSLTALVTLLGFYLKVRITPEALVAIFLLLIATTITGIIVRRLTFLPRWEWLVAGCLFAVLVGWRLYQARALAIPAWVDSLHHALIIQTILQTGQLPSELAGAANAPMFYHFGFHSITALFTAFSKLPVEQALLLFGQVMNACTALAVYRLVHQVWHDDRRGVLAALLVTFIAHMPAYYLTWGRYTLLTGMLLLALSIAEIEGCQRKSLAWASTVRLGLLTAGVLLTHYLAALLLALYLALKACGLLIAQLRRDKFELNQWVNIMIAPLLALLVCAPWLLRVWHYTSSQVGLNLTFPTQLGGEGITSSYTSYLWNLAGPRRNHLFLILAAIGLAFAIVRSLKSRLTVGNTLMIWSLCLIIGALPAGMNLDPFRPHHMVMVLFLPAVIWSADILVSAGEAISLVTKRPFLGNGVAGLAVVLLAAWGIKETANILNLGTIIANASDRHALGWVKENTPEDAAFFINVTPWQSGIYRGTDGGWWLPVISQRRALLPPVAYAWASESVVAEINQQAQQASGFTRCTPDFYQFLDRVRLNHIYIRKGSGSLQPGGLAGCPFISLIYEQDGVSIYQLKP